MKAEKWREGHGARFETTKYVLTHFTRSRTTPTANITITGTTIEPSQEARYLGVIFDRKLRFAQHIQHAAKKGTKFALAISRITKSTWGATYQQSRMLFNSVVAPRMDYAAIVWHRPKKEGNMTQSAQLSKIETAQRTAMKAILGAFRTTSTPALEIETSLQPPHLRIRRKVLQAFIRMQTTPQEHPIASAIRRAQTSKSKVHITTLEYIARTFPQYVSHRSKPSNRLRNPHGGNQHTPSTSLQTRRLQNKDTRKLQATPIYCAYSQMDLVLKDT
jgi:hypothetical protein